MYFKITMAFLLHGVIRPKKKTKKSIKKSNIYMDPSLYK